MRTLLDRPKAHFGHKHMQKAGPSKVALERQRKRDRHAQAFIAAKHKRSAAMSAYFEGLRDSPP